MGDRDEMRRYVDRYLLLLNDIIIMTFLSRARLVLGIDGVDVDGVDFVVCIALVER